MAASAFQYASGPTLELRDSLAAHRTQCSWWRPSPCSCCCDSQASIRLETTSKKTQPYVAQSHWTGSETTEHRPFLYIRVEEGSLSRTLAFDCGYDYALEQYAIRRQWEKESPIVHAYNTTKMECALTGEYRIARDWTFPPAHLPLEIIIIITIFFLTPVLNSRGKKKLRYAI